MTSSCLNPQTIIQTTNEIIVNRLVTGEFLSFIVTTSSMLPSLAPGDKLRVRAVPGSELRPGDILVRRIGNSWIAHRLIGYVSSDGERLLLTKGDNSLTSDEAWPMSDCAGVVVSVERERGKWDATSEVAGWNAALIACLSLSQLSAARVRPNIVRRLLIKTSRACLRIAAGFAQ
jgi:signal peptidase I